LKHFWTSKWEKFLFFMAAVAKIAPREMMAAVAGVSKEGGRRVTA